MDRNRPFGSGVTFMQKRNSSHGGLRGQYHMLVVKSESVDRTYIQHWSNDPPNGPLIFRGNVWPNLQTPVHPRYIECRSIDIMDFVFIDERGGAEGPAYLYHTLTAIGDGDPWYLHQIAPTDRPATQTAFFQDVGRPPRPQRATRTVISALDSRDGESIVALYGYTGDFVNGNWDRTPYVLRDFCRLPIGAYVSAQVDSGRSHHYIVDCIPNGESQVGVCHYMEYPDGGFTRGRLWEPDGRCGDSVFNRDSKQIELIYLRFAEGLHDVLHVTIDPQSGDHGAPSVVASGVPLVGACSVLQNFQGGLQCVVQVAATEEVYHYYKDPDERWRAGWVTRTTVAGQEEPKQSKG